MLHRKCGKKKEYVRGKSEGFYESTVQKLREMPAKGSYRKKWRFLRSTVEGLLERVGDIDIERG